MNRGEIHAALAALELPPGDWVLHASAVMVLNGLLEEAGDVDVVVRASAWRRALELGASSAGTHDLCVSLPSGVELWSGWLGQDVDALIDGSEPVDGVPCVSLAEVLRFKLEQGRPKDAPHIALLRDGLAVRQAAEPGHRTQ